MKSIKFIYKTAVIVILVLSLMQCDKEVKPDVITSDLEKAQQDMLAKLSASTWQITNFKRDGLDATAEFTNFKLTIGKQNYSTQSGAHLWPASGTWQFVEGKSTQVVRDDEVIIDVVLDDSPLSLLFKFDENIFTTGGRGQTVSSSLEFVLTN